MSQKSQRRLSAVSLLTEVSRRSPHWISTQHYLAPHPRSSVSVLDPADRWRNPTQHQSRVVKSSWSWAWLVEAKSGRLNLWAAPMIVQLSIGSYTILLLQSSSSNIPSHSWPNQSSDMAKWSSRGRSLAWRVVATDHRCLRATMMMMMMMTITYFRGVGTILTLRGWTFHESRPMQFQPLRPRFTENGVSIELNRYYIIYNI